MARCEVCGNDYDKTMEVIVGGERHVFDDSFECAIHDGEPVTPPRSLWRTVASAVIARRGW